MSAFRAEFLSARLGIVDPHAGYFLTPGMRRYAGAVYAADRRTIGRSLARFDRFGRRMTAAAARVGQFLMLGVGYDTRALWLPEIVAREVRVIEVDLPELMERKIRVLAENGVRYPDRVVPIGMNLADPDLRQRLAAAGFDPSAPAALFMEGVTFHLPPEVLQGILDPRRLGLASGSEVTFDFWTKERVVRRNEAFGQTRMHGFALPESPRELEAAPPRPRLSRHRHRPLVPPRRGPLARGRASGRRLANRRSERRLKRRARRS